MDTELIEKLEQLLPLAQKYESAKMIANRKKDYFISDHCKKPRKREIRNPYKPRKPSFKETLPFIISLAFLIPLVIITIVIFVKTGKEGFGGGMTAITLIFGLPPALFTGKYFLYDPWWSYKFHYEEYEKEMEKVKEDIDYNECEYPRLVEEYNAKVEELTAEFNKSVEDAQHQMEALDEEISKIGLVYPKSRYTSVFSVIQYLKNGEADTLKEALRLLNDHLERSLREFDEKERREQEQMFQMLKERQQLCKEREEQERLEIKERKEQREKEDRERAAKQEARRRCSNCIHNTSCRTYGSVNCHSYTPKKNFF